MVYQSKSVKNCRNLYSNAKLIKQIPHWLHFSANILLWKNIKSHIYFLKSISVTLDQCRSFIFFLEITKTFFFYFLPFSFTANQSANFEDEFSKIYGFSVNTNAIYQLFLCLYQSQRYFLTAALGSFLLSETVLGGSTSSVLHSSKPEYVLKQPESLTSLNHSIK